MKRIAFLISDGGTGSNLQAIIDAIENREIDAEIVLMVSVIEKAYGLQRAKKHTLL